MHIIMKNDKEVVGTLLGFDDFVNMVLEAGFSRYEITRYVIEMMGWKWVTVSG